MTVIYWGTLIGFIFYFAVAFCTPYSDNPPQKLYRSKDRKVFTGLCAGISDFTQVSLGWIRFIVIVCGLWVLGMIGMALFFAIEQRVVFAIVMIVIVAIAFVIYYLISSRIPFASSEN